MLHVADGDEALRHLRRAELEGAFLSWLDVPHDGPFPAGLSLAETAAVRARFLAGQGWVAVAEALARLDERNRILIDHLHAGRPVTLWFNAELFDQLQLLELLHILAEYPAAAANCAIVHLHGWLSDMTVAEIQAQSRHAVAVDADHLALGRQVWQAFRSPEPGALAEWLGRETQALPHLGAALLRLFEEYPGPNDGLSRTQRQIMTVLAAGSVSPMALFRQCRDLEPVPFMGDSTFWNRLAWLAAEPEPLLNPVGGGAFRLPQQAGTAFDEQVLALTDAGHEVLAGRLDAVAKKGLDQWIGGVHLKGTRVWRWDGRSRRFLVLG